MNKEVRLALSYALNKGFQIHPDALKILEERRLLSQLGRDNQRNSQGEGKAKGRICIGQTDLEEFLGNQAGG